MTHTDVDGLFAALGKVDLLRRVTPVVAFCIKATTTSGRRVDCFFPEVPSGNYDGSKDATP